MSSVVMTRTERFRKAQFGFFVPMKQDAHARSVRLGARALAAGRLSRSMATIAGRPVMWVGRRR
jgi:hypothetical protein